jgi:hypothetical protein
LIESSGDRVALARRIGRRRESSVRRFKGHSFDSSILDENPRPIYQLEVYHVIM